jgi:hypothetical protein
MMRKELLDEPISTKATVFLETVLESIDCGQLLIVLNRYAYRGGYRDFFLVKNRDDFDKILNAARSRDSISVFFEGAVQIKGVVGESLTSEILKVVKPEFDKSDEYAIFIVRSDSPKSNLEGDYIRYFTSIEKMSDWLDTHKGVPIIVSDLPYWEKNSNKVVTAYIPDADGVVRTGAY